MKFTHKIYTGGTLVFVILCLNIFISYRAIQALVASDKRVVHSYSVLQELEATFSTLKDAETGQRGYLLTWQKHLS
jgi:CHASE3 domain sensor protein